MDGYLDERGSPRLSIRLADATAALEALIDTGFEGELLAYVDQLEGLGLRPVSRDVARFRLADGSEATFFVATIRVTWHDEDREVDLDIVPAAAPSGASALLGCGLLRDSRLEIDFPRGVVVLSNNARA